MTFRTGKNRLELVGFLFCKNCRARKKEVSGPAGESYEKAAALFTATLTREKAAWKPRFSWKAHPWENTAKTGFCPDWKANFVAQFFRIFYNLS
jgi:hypothetical protein